MLVGLNSQTVLNVAKNVVLQCTVPIKQSRILWQQRVFNVLRSQLGVLKTDMDVAASQSLKEWIKEIQIATNIDVELGATHIK